jgi:hypothetical protein
MIFVKRIFFATPAIFSFAVGIALAQSIGPQVVPSPQVIPVYPELGAGVVVTAPEPPPGPVPSPLGGNGGTGLGGGTQGGGTAMSSYDASGFSQAGIAAAESLGITPDAIAGIAYAESHDQNIGDSNGSTSAFGVYQITQGTWESTVQQNNLPYTLADMSNPADQAVVASYILQNYGNAVSQFTNGPPTVLQTYGAYMFGPTPGGEIATAPASTPLSEFVSPTALQNNDMSGWTVGEYQSVMSSRLGGTANDQVFA